MLFNSVSFALFLPLVFVLHWLLAKKSLTLQNGLLMVASYFFYACWDWRFMFLLIFSTMLDYFSGIMIHDSRNQKRKTMWLWISIVVNLGFLGAFKYYNFFADSLAAGLEQLGVKVNPGSLQVILPVGISFYTFHGLSYVLDLYKNKIKPERNVVNYSLFVSFFPLLVAGPIERATHLLPQLVKKREFDYSKAIDGLRQILWGLFKKIVIADNCAVYANEIFSNPADYSGSVLLIGAVLFAVQIYCDFSGYSDIAIGVAKLFGIDLLRNFAFPYFSRDIAEFWRRWHISLSSWFKDYLYIPLGGSKGSIWKRIRNTFIIFIVSGFWHGANWTFVVWGTLNAIYILPSIVFKTNRNNIDIVAKGKLFPTIRDFFSMGITFLLTVFAWVFFRAASVNQAMAYISSIFSKSIVERPVFPKNESPIFVFLLIVLFMVVEWLGRENKFAIEKICLKWPSLLRWTLYLVICIFIYAFAGSQQQFIYFQF